MLGAPGHAVRRHERRRLRCQRLGLNRYWASSSNATAMQRLPTQCYDSLSALPRLELDLRVVPPDSELRLAAPWRPPAASRLCLLVRAGIRRSPFSNEAAAEEAVQQPAALLQAGGAAAAQALQAGATPADAAAIARHVATMLRMGGPAALHGGGAGLAAAYVAAARAATAVTPATADRALQHWGDAELTCAAADHEDVDAPTAALLRWLPYQLPDLYGLSLPYDAVGGRGLALLGAGLTRLCKLSLGHVALRSGQHGVLEVSVGGQRHQTFHDSMLGGRGLRGRCCCCFSHSACMPLRVTANSHTRRSHALLSCRLPPAPAASWPDAVSGGAALRPHHRAALAAGLRRARPHPPAAGPTAHVLHRLGGLGRGGGAG